MVGSKICVMTQTWSLLMEGLKSTYKKKQYLSVSRLTVVTLSNKGSIFYVRLRTMIRKKTHMDSETTYDDSQTDDFG